MNLTYIRIDLVRDLRDVSVWMFIVALPVAMLLLFSQSAESGAQAGNGNVSFHVTVSMASFSAAIAATAIAGTAVTEFLSGWGRQLALAGQRVWQTIANKVVVATILSALTTGIVLGAGALTGARAGTWQIWAWSYLLVLVGAPLFAMYGFAAAVWFRTDLANGVAASIVTLFGFFGNVFMPLGGDLLAFARFTPMYGYAALARYPVSEGWVLDRGTVIAERPWWWITNVMAWLILFTLAAIWGARRARAAR